MSTRGALADASSAQSPSAEKIHEVDASVVEFAVAADGTRLAYTLQPSEGDRYHISDLGKLS